MSSCVVLTSSNSFASVLTAWSVRAASGARQPPVPAAGPGPVIDWREEREAGAWSQRLAGNGYLGMSLLQPLHQAVSTGDTLILTDISEIILDQNNAKCGS